MERSTSATSTGSNGNRRVLLRDRIASLDQRLRAAKEENDNMRARMVTMLTPGSGTQLGVRTSSSPSAAITDHMAAYRDPNRRSSPQQPKDVSPQRQHMATNGGGPSGTRDTYGSIAAHQRLPSQDGAALLQGSTLDVPGGRMTERSLSPSKASATTYTRRSLVSPPNAQGVPASPDVRRPVESAVPQEPRSVSLLRPSARSHDSPRAGTGTTGLVASIGAASVEPSQLSPSRLARRTVDASPSDRSPAGAGLYARKENLTHELRGVSAALRNTDDRIDTARTHLQSAVADASHRHQATARAVLDSDVVARGYESILRRLRDRADEASSELHSAVERSTKQVKVFLHQQEEWQLLERDIERQTKIVAESVGSKQGELRALEARLTDLQKLGESQQRQWRETAEAEATRRQTDFQRDQEDVEMRAEKLRGAYDKDMMEVTAQLRAQLEATHRQRAQQRSDIRARHDEALWYRQQMAEIDVCNGENDRLGAECTRIEAKIAAVEREANDVEAASRAVEARIADAESTITFVSDAGEALAELGREEEQLQQRRVEWQERRDTLRKRLLELDLEAQMPPVKRQLDSLEDEVDRVRREIAATEERVRGQGQEHGRRLAAAEKALNDKLQEVTDVDEASRRVRQQLEEVTQSLRVAETEADSRTASAAAAARDVLRHLGSPAISSRGHSGAPQSPNVSPRRSRGI